MALVTKITSNTKDFTLYQQPTGGLSTAVFRYEDASIAPMFRPTVAIRASENSTKTNNTVYLDVKLPVVETVNGVTVANNKVQFKASFTSLQNVLTPAVSDTIDLAIASLTALKQNFVSGRVN